MRCFRSDRRSSPFRAPPERESAWVCGCRKPSAVTPRQGRRAGGVERGGNGSFRGSDFARAGGDSAAAAHCLRSVPGLPSCRRDFWPVDTLKHVDGWLRLVLVGSLRSRNYSCGPRAMPAVWRPLSQGSLAPHIQCVCPQVHEMWPTPQAIRLIQRAYADRDIAMLFTL